VRIGSSLFARGGLNYMLHTISPLWILSSGRTGSSFLVSFFNAALGSREFKEFTLGVDHRNEILKRPPRFIKLQRQFFEQSGFDDSDRNKIKKIHPKIRYIVLKRKDVVGQTISLYLAEKTKCWGVYSDDKLAEYKSMKVDWDQDRVMLLYDRVLRSADAWDSYVQDQQHMTFYYEDIFGDNQKEVLARVSDFSTLNVNVEENIEKIRLKKMQHPATEKYIQKLNTLIGS